MHTGATESGASPTQDLSLSQTRRVNFSRRTAHLLVLVSLAVAGCVIVSLVWALPAQPKDAEAAPPEPKSVRAVGDAAHHREEPDGEEKKAPVPPAKPEESWKAPAVAVQEKTPRAGRSRPAPKGFQGFRLGLTRKEVHRLVEQWNKARVVMDRDGPEVFDVPYAGVKKLLTSFDDGDGLAMERLVPPGKYFHEWFYIKSRDLPPDQAEARLTLLVVEFEELKEGSPEKFLKTLRGQYGPPDYEGKPLPVGRFGFGFRLDVGPVMENQQMTAWFWKEDDRVAVAQVTRYGEHVFGELGTFVVRLLVADGLFARAAVAEALTQERQQKERARAAKAAETLRQGITDERKPPGEQRSSVFPDQLLPIPEALCGLWHVQAAGAGTKREGYLQLEKRTEQEVRGRFEWLEGRMLGSVPFKVLLTRMGEADTRVLLCRVEQGGEKTDGREPETYAAALSKDGQTLVAGECSQEAMFSWRARKLTVDMHAKQEAKLSPAGAWEIKFHRSNATLSLREMGTQFPLRRIVGNYTQRPEPFSKKNVSSMEVVGVFNVRTNRLWFATFDPTAENSEREAQSKTRDARGLPAQKVFEGSLTADGTRLLRGRFSNGEPLGEFVTLGSWDAIRDHLVPVQKPKWRLFLPWEVSGAGVEGARLLEGLMDVYGIDLAVPVGEKEYAYLGRTAERTRSPSRIKELPRGVMPFEFRVERSGERAGDLKVLNAVLRKYRIPESDVVLFVLPPSMVESMRRVERQYLKERRGLEDERLIQETEFHITYDRTRRQPGIEVRKQSVAVFLSW